MTGRPPVLMIGLDAADAASVERMCDAGELPALDALRRRGAVGRLRSDGRRFAGGIWPTVYTSQEVPWHGLYHNKLWRPERQRCEIPDEGWEAPPPFWRLPAMQARLSAVIDVPMTLGPSVRSSGVELTGWGTHDTVIRAAWPASLWSELRRRFGAPRMRAERFGPQTAASLLRLRRELLETTQQLGEITESLARRHAWDLFFVVFGAPHRAGHYLWDLSQIDGDRSSEVPAPLPGALKEVYQACDRAVGRLVSRFPTETRVLVFGAHGMGPNPGWSDRCPEILARIQGNPPKSGVLYALKRRVPWPLLRPITTRLPDGVTRWMVTAWSSRMFDWERTRYFPLPMDQAGYLRINCKGREPRGTVDPGPEYEALCRELESAFRSFRDIDSGEPIVDEVLRAADLAPASAPHRDRLPDLVITWRPVRSERGIESARYGRLLWSSPRLPSGRAGNHRDGGWLVTAGPGIEAASDLEASVLDLVPTLFHWLDLPLDPAFQGRPIPMLCKPS